MDSDDEEEVFMFKKIKKEPNVIASKPKEQQKEKEQTGHIESKTGPKRKEKAALLLIEEPVLRQPHQPVSSVNPDFSKELQNIDQMTKLGLSKLQEINYQVNQNLLKTQESLAAAENEDDKKSLEIRELELRIRDLKSKLENKNDKIKRLELKLEEKTNYSTKVIEWAMKEKHKRKMQREKLRDDIKVQLIENSAQIEKKLLTLEEE